MTNFIINKKSRNIIILAIIAFTFILYGNSIKNEYALDDELVTVTNPDHPEQSQAKIMKGFKGIPEIFTSHYSTRNKTNYAYRPVVLTTFALEYQFFGSNPHISHFINVLLYALTCVLIFLLLLKLFSNYNIIFPLLITGFFIAHPLHTEVVNNLKSRDELLCFLGSLLSLKYFLNYVDSGKIRNIFYGLIFFVLAFLSKITAVTFLLIVPLTIFYFKTTGWRKVVIPAASIFAMVLLIRGMKHIILTDTVIRKYWFFENPLFYEEGFIVRIPAAIYTMGYYLRLLIFPHPLSCYYGYDYIPVTGWADTGSLLPVAFYFVLGAVIIGAGIYALIKLPGKGVLSYGILFYLIGIAGLFNLIRPIVGIIGERFTYIASLGFCITGTYLLLRFYKIPFESNYVKYDVKPAFILTIIVILGLYSVRTITRNMDWKDHLTLYRHDIKHLDRSSKAHTLLAGTAFSKLPEIQPGPERDKLIKEAIKHFKEGLKIYPGNYIVVNNLGTIYFNFLEDYKTAASYYKKAIELNPDYIEAYYSLGFSYEKLGDQENAILFFNKTLELDDMYFPAYIRLTRLYETKGEYDKAISINMRGLENFPQSETFYVNIGNAYSLKNDTLSALKYFESAIEIRPVNYDLCKHIAGIYELIGDNDKADEYFKKAKSASN
ncbi:MAG: tetratricopeptide repeat protein [Bacteroidota bacterium]